jgi:hydrogenase expression/formation protein HypE
LFFAGGDIGTLAVCGTVNDLLVMGALPKYLTCGFIIEEGFRIAELDRVAASMAESAREAGVVIVAGDTKVIERRHSRARGSGFADSPPSADEGGESGLFINTTGIGFLRGEILCGGAGAPSASGAREGDAVILSGTLGDHHACILSARLSVVNGIRSDCAALSDVAGALYAAGAGVHVMRDVTRGGLGTVLNEIASSSRVSIELDEDSIPVTGEVRAFCGIMGLDPVYMGNEGKLVAIIPENDAERALAAMKGTKHGAGARIIGRVTRTDSPEVTMKTRIGGTRRLPMLQGEGLPRIC